MELWTTISTHKPSLSTQEQANMVKMTAKPAISMPNDVKAENRRQNILNSFTDSKVGCDPILAEFGIENVPAKMTDVNAHVISPPKIEYGQDKVIDVRDGKWDNKDKTFFETPSKFKWALINSSNLEEEKVNQIRNTLIKVSELHNLCMGNPKYVKINIIQNETELEKLFSGASYDLIVFILPVNSSEAYSELKCYIFYTDILLERKNFK